MSAKRDWQGDLDDDCTLERYGLFAQMAVCMSAEL